MYRKYSKIIMPFAINGTRRENHGRKQKNAEKMQGISSFAHKVRPLRSRKLPEPSHLKTN